MRIDALHTYLQRVGNRPRVLVKITTDSGVEGWSEVYNHGPDLAYPPLLDYLFEQIRGMDARRPSHVDQILLQSCSAAPSVTEYTCTQGCTQPPTSPNSGTPPRSCTNASASPPSSSAPVEAICTAPGSGGWRGSSAATTNFGILEYKPDTVSWCPPSASNCACAMRRPTWTRWICPVCGWRSTVPK
ncbi:hypothetical protein [Streptomyces sp. Inha503]|uniref:hypothetical protein n=1 Tax=Streptomyces sp. Inha503 TaxID=3383314 RepID=UPI0039A3B463